MKFGQLTEYNMRNIFLEKSYTKCGGEIILRPFSKMSKLSIYWINCQKCYSLFFIVCKVENYIETKMQTTCFIHVKLS